jgi:hypothetical protein
VTPRFVVVAGAHAGASLPIDQSIYTVGSSIDCDVVLRDPELVEQHFKICLGKNRSVVIEALGGAVWIGDLEVAKGSGYRGTFPLQIRVGQTLVELQGVPGRNWLPAFLPSVAAWFNRNAAVAGGGVAGICLLLYPFIAMSEADASAAAPAAPPAMAAPVAASMKPVQPASVDAEQALKAHLAEVGLDHLNLNTQGSYFQVSGEVSVGEMQQWQATQRWFDERYGRTHLLHGAVSLRQVLPTPRVRFQAIWTGKDPYVIGDRGQRLYPGASVNDGWMIRRIEPGQVILARDGQEFSLTL